MILRQFLDTDPVVAASYLVGCGGRGVAAVIDPVEGSDRYLEEAAALGMRIAHVIDTHVHADHVSTGRELAEAAGADYALWEGIARDAGARGLHDGETLEVGNVRLEVWHTPGHTPEHVSYLVADRSRSSEPSGTSHRCSPESRSTATSVPNGGGVHGIPDGESRMRRRMT